MASSSESCGLSRWRTTSSRRARERSKSGFLGASGFLGTGEFTRRPCLSNRRNADQHHRSVIAMQTTCEHSKARVRKDTIALWCDDEFYFGARRDHYQNKSTRQLFVSRVTIPASKLKCVCA